MCGECSQHDEAQPFKQTEGAHAGLSAGAEERIRIRNEGESWPVDDENHGMSCESECVCASVLENPRKGWRNKQS